jgi:hypothetical protein
MEEPDCLPAHVITESDRRRRVATLSLSSIFCAFSIPLRGSRKTAIVSRHYQSNFAPTRQTRGGTIASGRRNELPELQLVF